MCALLVAVLLWLLAAGAACARAPCACMLRLLLVLTICFVLYCVSVSVLHVVLCTSRVLHSMQLAIRLA